MTRLFAALLGSVGLLGSARGEAQHGYEQSRAMHERMVLLSDIARKVRT